MSSFFTMTFMLVFLPIVLIAYWLAPRGARGPLLCAASHAFAWRLSGVLVGFMIATAAVAYASGVAMAALLEKRSALVKLKP